MTRIRSLNSDIRDSSNVKLKCPPLCSVIHFICMSKEKGRQKNSEVIVGVLLLTLLLLAKRRDCSFFYCTLLYIYFSVLLYKVCYSLISLFFSFIIFALFKLI